MTQNDKENLIFSPFATFSRDAKRVVFEELKPHRTDFQRDRDRIIHSDAFRRLKDKTQVFIHSDNDHNRTRLTHTLEVSQIARVIARALDLNEDLTEAIALGHDLGHTPFGHAGEDALDELTKKSLPASENGTPQSKKLPTDKLTTNSAETPAPQYSGGFKHAEHSVRVTELENLNLTLQVKDGIINHTGKNVASTLEGQIIKFADRIAYINHDIQDSIREGVLQLEDLPKSCIEALGETHSKRINTLVNSIIKTSYGKNLVAMDENIHEEMLKLRQFLFDNVYSKLSSRVDYAKNIIGTLFEHYTQLGWEQTQIVDYIAGMTDNFALASFKKLSKQRSISVPLQNINKL